MRTYSVPSPGYMMKMGTMWPLLSGSLQLLFSYETLIDCVQSPAVGIVQESEYGQNVGAQGALHACAEGRLGVSSRDSTGLGVLELHIVREVQAML